MYGEVITSVNCLSKTVRWFGSIIIGLEKFGSKHECRSLRSARITASWTNNHGSISPESGVRPGKVDCFIQHTLKIASQSQQHVFALLDWYIEDESKLGHVRQACGSLEESISSWWPITVSSCIKIYSKFVVASVSVDKLVIDPLNGTFS